MVKPKGVKGAMKRMLRIVELSILTLLILCLIVLWYFIFISRGTIQPFYDENGKILKNSIAERTYVDINGVKNGMFIRGKNINQPVLLLVSSGPGTPDYFLTEAYPDMNLDNYFTICYWEYRGSCLSYDSKMYPTSITTDTLVSDTVEITNYLKERFHKDKIYIMGFSGGSYIALNTVARYPDNYYAYFGMAQVVCKGPDNDTPMYEYMKKTFTKRKDNKRLKKLEEQVYHLENGQVSCKEWGPYVMLLHEAGGGTIKDKTEFTSIVLPILTCHCYTFHEKFDYIKGMKFYDHTTLKKEQYQNDFRKTVPSVEIPIYFLSGSYDYNCPWEVVNEYCKQINAPKKGFYLIENSAHSPLWEQPKETIDIILELTKDQRNEEISSSSK